MADLPKSEMSDEDRILFWRQNICEAAKDLLGVDLFPHHRLILKARQREQDHLDLLTRGAGKTWTNAVDAALTAMLYPGTRVGLMGPSLRQSRQLFDELRGLWHQSPYLQQCAPDGVIAMPDRLIMNFVPAPGVKPSIIGAVPIGTDGGLIRGERFHKMIADELAQWDKSVLDLVIKPFMATRRSPAQAARYMIEMRKKVARGELREEDIVKPESNKFVGTSTAFYQWNHLWEDVCTRMNTVLNPIREYAMKNRITYEEARAYFNENNKYNVAGETWDDGQIPHRIISNGKIGMCAFIEDDMPEGFLDEEYIKGARIRMTDYMYRMEHRCFFPSDSNGFFPLSLLEKARSHSEFVCQLKPRHGFRYVAGLDPARTTDNFAIAIMEIDDENKLVNLVRVLTWNKREFGEMTYNVRRVVRDYGIEKMVMDAGGGGTTIRDLLAKSEHCPVGELPILEDDFEEHNTYHGQRLLFPLAQFSNTQWLQDANFNLLAGLQRGQLRIAAAPQYSEQLLYTPELDEADQEIKATIMEMGNIVMSSAGSRNHFDTPQKGQRKDRYTAVMLAFDCAMRCLGNTQGGPNDVSGFWLRRRR